MSTTYLPGIRNLDSKETSQRRNNGWVGLGLTLVCVVGLIYFHVAAAWRLLLFFPVTLAAIGFLQASAEFCVMVALSSRSPAHDASERSKDRRKAFGMIALAALIGAGAATLAYFYL